MMNGVQHLTHHHHTSSVLSSPYDDLFFQEILTRLPVKSAVRCKCISKEWLSRIGDKKFKSLHGSKSEPRPCICITIQHKNQVLLFTADLYTQTVSFVQKMMFTRVEPPEIVEVCDFKDISFKYRPINGLACLYNFNGDVCIYNLTTREMTPWIEPPYITKVDKNAIHILPRYRFGFDPINNEYKVICIGEVTTLEKNDDEDEDEYEGDGTFMEYTACNVLTVSSGGHYSWKNMDAVPPCMVEKDGVYANGFIYWMERRWNSIVAFNVGSEKYIELSFPEEFYAKEEVYDNYDLIEVGGCIAIIKRVSRDTIKLWKMVDDDMKMLNSDTNTQWIKETILLASSSSPCSIRLEKLKFLSIPGTNLIIIIPKEIKPDKKSVLLKCYDWKMKTFKEIDITGILPMLTYDCTYTIGAYMESLSHV